MKPILTSITVIALAIPSVAAARSYDWTGPQPCGSPPCSGLWDDQSNWSPPGIPGGGDTATINGTTDPMALTTVTLGSDSVGGLTVSGRTELTGRSLTVASGNAVLNGGTFLGATLTLAAGVTTTLGGDVELSGGKLNNAGTFNWLTGTLSGDSGVEIHNSGSFVITAGTALAYGSGLDNCDFYNTGVVELDGAGTTTSADGLCWAFHNSGVVTFVGGGTLEWQASGNTQHSLEDGGQVTGDGTLLYDEPHTSWSDSKLTVNGTTHVATGATLAFGPGSRITAGTAGGTIAGPGKLLWLGGHIDGSRTYATGPALNWANGLNVAITGPATKDMSGTYIVSGATVTWDQGILAVGDGGYFTNTGTFTAKGDLAISPTGTEYYSQLENRGTFIKQSGNGALTVDSLSFLNYGTLSAASGSIRLVAKGNGPNVLEGGSTLSGQVTALCEVALGGSSTVAAGGNFELGNDGTHAGQLDGSGAIGGDGTVTVDGAAIDATGTNALTFAAGGHLAFTPNAAKTFFQVDPKASMTFAGNTTWTGGTIELQDGTATNTGTWTTTGAALLTNNVSSATFENRGTFAADPGATTLQVDLNFLNSGTVIASSGTLLFAHQDFVQTGGETRLSGGTVGVHTPYTTPDYRTMDIKGGSLTGAGTVDAVVTNEGIVAPGTAASAGTLTVTQTYTQSDAGTLAVDLGGVQAGQFDVLATGGDVKIDGTLAVSLLGGYLPAVGSTYKVLVSGGADPDQGAFATVAPQNGLSVTTTYHPNDVTLGVTGVTAPDAGVDAGTNSDGGMPDAGTGTPRGGSCASGHGANGGLSGGLVVLGAVVVLGALRRRAER